MAGYVNVRRLSSDIKSRTTSFRLDVDTKRLDAIGEETGRLVREIVKDYTALIQAKAQEIIREKNIIKTGNLLGSVVWSYDETTSVGTVFVGARYGIYIEFGTIYMGARPFLGPAVDYYAAEFVQAVYAAVKLGTGNK